MVHNHSPLLTMVKPVLMYLYSTLPRVLFVVYENTMFQSYRPFCSGFGADRTEAVLKSLTLLSNKRATNSTHPGMSQCAVKSGLSLSLKNVLRSIFTPTFSQTGANQGIRLALTGASVDPPSGLHWMVDPSCALEFPIPLDQQVPSVERKPHRVCSLGIHPEKRGHVLHCSSLVEYSQCDSAYSHY